MADNVQQLRRETGTPCLKIPALLQHFKHPTFATQLCTANGLSTITPATQLSPFNSSTTVSYTHLTLPTTGDV